MTDTPPTIVIVGGGFGGVKCAEVLGRKLEGARVVLFNRENHLVFSPLLAEVVGSSIDALDVIVPLRQLLPRVFCRTEEVRAIDCQRHEVEFLGERGRPARMRYDHLVLACGSRTNLNVVPGMADHAFPLKSVGDAATLRSHIMEQFEAAEVAATPERRRWHLTFLVVGGGYSGVEAAGEINDLARGSAKYFRTWNPRDINVTLIHSRDEILPEISSPLRKFARRKMERAGVTMRLESRVMSATAEGVLLSDGSFLSGGTIVCTIGNSSALLAARLEAPKQKDRLVTRPDLRLATCENVWAIGDTAWSINAATGQPCPTTGQFAERQGRQCAENIVRMLRGKPTRPFRFKQLGELCSIGGHSAVADLFGLQISGFLAWFLWRGIYFWKLPTLGRKLQVGFDWASLLVFPRDLAHIRTEETGRVTHAHYEPGNFIFRRGDPPANFYVLEKGEVEIVRETDTGDGEIVSILGPGSFFGERALIGDRPRVMSARARTPIEVLIMGKNVFSQISAALTPLRDALAHTLNRRTMDVWKDRPQVYELLRATRARALMEPAPGPFLKPEHTLRQAGQEFISSGNEFFFVSGEDGTLSGVVTITDLMRARPDTTGEETRVAAFMTPKPVAVSPDDTCEVVAAVLREYRLKNLPVVDANRKILGVIRVRRLMAFVLQRLPAATASPVSSA